MRTTLPAQQRRATLIGAIAVLLWALLALFTTAAAGIPPFELTALTFAVAFVAGLGAIAWRGASLKRVFRQPPGAWGLGVAGLFGYHFFYFVALGNAPPAEVSLVAYLWPLLIVLLSERPRLPHLVGAVLGLVGAGLLVTRGQGFVLRGEYLLGYGAALACALTWSTYSVTNRRFGGVPTETVAGFCGVVAVLALLCHLALEETVIPAAGQWLAIAGLGLGPVGLAFFVWDYGTKHGSLQVLGTLSYAAPLLSTLLLVAFGIAEAHWTLAAGAALIVGGALVASRELLPRRTPPLPAPRG